MSNRSLLRAFGAALAVIASGCNADKVTDVNQNPNSPTDAPSSALFTNAARLGVSRWLDGVGGTRYAFLSQHFAEVQYPDADGYLRLRASSTSGLFNGSYSAELEDFELVSRRGAAAGKPGTAAPAQIMKAWEFGILTDVFGDVPYSQAFKADSQVLTPAYDKQQDIYTDLFAKLTAASASLATASNDLGTADPIYAGSPAAWRKFANSLRLRQALRLVNVDPAKSSAQIQAALSDAGGIITTNAENAKLVWPGDGIYDNPWANNFKTRDDHRISSRLVTYMRDYSDPRVSVFAMPAEVDQPAVANRTIRYCPSGAPPCYVGLYNALTHAQASTFLPYTSRPGAVFYPGATAYGTFGGSGGTYPSYLMTAAEVEFIRAEAAERGLGGLTPAQAPAFYNAAITRSMEMYGVPAASIAAYLANPAVNYLTAASQQDRLKRIAIQKWLTLYTDPIQAWAEVRRTCQPAIVEPGPNALTSVLPRRLQYSTTERAVNSSNLADAVTRQGADNFNTRIYWDKSPTVAPTYEPGCNDRSS